MTPIAPPPATTLTPKPAPEREKLGQVARQFEAIFVRQMLAAARKTGFDANSEGGGAFGSQAMQTFRQMQDERFAEIASHRGAFGLARVLEARLARFVAQDGPPAHHGRGK